MAKSKGTKRSLLTSFLCILLSLSLLVSSTAAWFTDRVSTKKNIITSGNLDLEMYWTDDPTTDVWYNVEEDAYNTIFTYDNWEPGYTDVKYIKIVNKGSLALNYDLSIEAQGAVGKLAEVINVYYAINDDKLNLRSDLDQLSAIGLLSNVMNGGSQASGTLLPAGTTSLFHQSGEVIVTLAMQMVTTAGNEYQNESSGNFTIKALATQAPWERDSFGTDYDSTAEMPITLVATNITVPVVPTAENTVDAAGLEMIGAAASAYLPAGVKLEPGVTELNFKVTPLETSTSGISVVNDEIKIPVDVHIEGVAEDNDIPIVIDLGPIMPKYLNMGNYKLVHVEDGVTNIMTQVSSRDALTAHNQFAYNSDTGSVSVCMASFSAVEAIVDNANPWKGGVDYSWFTSWAVGGTDDNAYRRLYTLTNADQLYGFAKLLGGMHVQDEKWNALVTAGKITETVLKDERGVDIVDWGFNGHTVTLMSDVDLGGGNVIRESDGKKVMFYPIGYYNNTKDITTSPIIYDRADGTAQDITIQSDFKAFRGTFNGNGHTISNLYQNTWEMFGDYNSGYPNGSNYYKDGMGLFGWLYGATIYNTNMKNFQCDGEFTPTGVIAAFAEAAQQDADAEKGILQDWGATTISGVTLTDCNPRVYNTGNGGIVGIGGRAGNQYSTDTEKGKACQLIFSKITVDRTNKISALWGSWDVACGGIMGMFRGNGRVDFTNCSVSAQIDVFNDVCGNYQYYWYRYAGMIIGSIRGKNVTNKDGYIVPDLSNIYASECTVQLDKWNDYYYCELVANSLASYTHDHQMSRLEQIGSLSEIKSGDTWTKTGNFLLISGDTKTCYHIVNKDGVLTEHKHEDSGYETKDINGDSVIDSNVLKEDKQIIYLPFDQLFQGDGWGVKNVAICDLDNYPNLKITILKKDDLSKEKFTANYPGTTPQNPLEVGTGATITVGDLFSAIDSGNIRTGSVGVFVEKVKGDGTYERVVVESSKKVGNKTVTIPWTERKIQLGAEDGAIYQINIQDYDYCLPTYIYLKAVGTTKEHSCKHCEGMNAQWTPWYPGALPGGHYYLTQDVEAYAPITLKAGAKDAKTDVVLDLEGHTMTFPETAAVDVGLYQSFSIVDSSDGKTGKMVGFGDEYGLLKVSGGDLNLYEGEYSYISDVITLVDDEAQISTKGIIWAANPETDNVETNVLFTDGVTIPATAQIFLAAEAEMRLKGSIDGTKISLIELESGALLNIQEMKGNSAQPIVIKANGEFAYIEQAQDDDHMEACKTWFKPDVGYSEIDTQAKSLLIQIDLKESIKDSFDQGERVATATADMAQLIESGTCPMCGAENAQWEPYSANHALMEGGSKVHIYLDSTHSDKITGGNFIGSRKGNSVMCVMLKDANITTEGRFLVNPGNILNIMGKGSIHSEGTSGLGMFTVLGKNAVVNIYGGTYTYSGSYMKNEQVDDPEYALIYASSKSSVVNLYEGAIIGYSDDEIRELSPEKRANYNVNMYGTLNMYGGTIRNGISADEWYSGNVTVNSSGVLNMYAGTITGGKTIYRGGNVLMRSLATINMGYREDIDGITMEPQITNGEARYSAEAYQTELDNRLKAYNEKVSEGLIDPDTTPAPVMGDINRVPGGGNIGTRDFTGYITFNMYTGSITNGAVDSSGAEGTDRSGYKVYMGGGNIYMHGLWSNEAVLKGGIVSGGQAYAGGNIYMRNGAEVIIDGATIENGVATEQGGNINVFNGAVLTVESGTITGGQAHIGGSINIGQGAGKAATALIKGGTISGGTALGANDGNSPDGRGGNITVIGESVLEISGGVIHSGVAQNNRYGDNIHILYKEYDNTVKLPKVTISGGKIAGGVLLQAKGADHVPTLILKGAPIIKNTIDGVDTTGHHGLWVSLDSTIADVSGLTSGAQIDIYKGTPDGMNNNIPLAVASDNAETVAEYFTSCRVGYDVACVDNVIQLVKTP